MSFFKKPLSFSLSLVFVVAFAATVHASTICHCRPCTAGASCGVKTTGPESLLPLSGEAGLVLFSENICHGDLMANKGVTFMPYVVLSIPVYAGEGWVNRVGLDFGYGNVTSYYKSEGTQKRWWCDKNEWLAGVSVGVAEKFTFSVAYIYYTFPVMDMGMGMAMSRPDAQALHFTLAYDDRDLLGAWALRPYFTYLHELDGSIICQHADNPRGSYYELGVAPALPSMGKVELTVPIRVGLGSDGFYLKHGRSTNYGFTAVGLNAGVPLTFIPASMGRWQMTAAATYYNLSERNARGRHRDRVVFSSGVRVAF